MARLFLWCKLAKPNEVGYDKQKNGLGESNCFDDFLPSITRISNNNQEVSLEAVLKSSIGLSDCWHRALLSLAFITSALSLLAFAQPAQAEFRVCNRTQNLAGVAIGYRAKEGWVTEGWWWVPSTICTTLIKGELQSRYYYLYAEDAARGGRWGGQVNMCVAENEFKISGVKDCYAKGYQQSGFKEYDTGRHGSWIVQLTDSPATQESQN